MLACVLVALAGACCEVTGVVRDLTGRGLEAVAVAADAGAVAVVTDADGVFRLSLPAGQHVLRFSRPSHATVTRELDLQAGAQLEVTLAALPHIREQVVVQAIRAEAQAPVTKTDIDRDAIARENYGQEMPFLLQAAPSITQYSENGSSGGYSYFYLRGIHQTRINMTLDGVPLNDPEESAVYFSNYGDFASAVDSIQIQRGVGTSSVGAASFGGSINFASAAIGETRRVSGVLGAGSFGERRISALGQTGRVGGGLAFSGRASWLTSDGFRERSGVSQRTFYFGASRHDSHSLLKAFAFSGRERTQLSFLAVEKDVLEQNLRTNPLSAEEKDRFGQDLAHVQWTRLIGRTGSISAQAYYNGAQGWFRLWDDPVARTALQQYGIDGRAVGSLVTYRLAALPWSATVGVHWNDFHRDHFLDVVGGQRSYFNTGFKRELSSFAKLAWERGPWHVYGDAQLRRVRFRYQGSLPLGAVSWTLLNPKLGVRRDLDASLSVYVSAGRATREPPRNDLLAGEDDATVVHDLRAVRPERVVDFEAGTEFRSERVALRANAYAMEFKDEIAATGELSEIGQLLRRNVDRSSRRGLELELTAVPGRGRDVRLTTVANLSRNRIREWTQFYDVYDAAGSLAGQAARVHRDVSPLLTPALILRQSVSWNPAGGLAVEMTGRYVARSFLDNTNAAGFTAPAFGVLDARAALSLPRRRPARARLTLRVTNLLDNRRVFPSGYSYLFLSRDAAGRESLGGTPYYYPLSTRAAFLTLELNPE